MSITVTYQLNGTDAMECVRVHDTAFNVKLVVSVLASVTLVLSGVLWLALPGDHTLAWISIGAGGMMLIYIPVQRARIAHRVRQQWSQFDVMELTVGDAGFVARTRGASSDVAWSRFVRFKEARNHFLLYTSKDIYSIVPKRGFVSIGDVEIFKELAASKIAGPQSRGTGIGA